MDFNDSLKRNQHVRVLEFYYKAKGQVELFASTKYN